MEEAKDDKDPSPGSQPAVIPKPPKGISPLLAQTLSNLQDPATNGTTSHQDASLTPIPEPTEGVVEDATGTNNDRQRTLIATAAVTASGSASTGRDDLPSSPGGGREKGSLLYLSGPHAATPDGYERFRDSASSRPPRPPAGRFQTPAHAPTASGHLYVLKDYRPPSIGSPLFPSVARSSSHGGSLPDSPALVMVSGAAGGGPAGGLCAPPPSPGVLSTPGGHAISGGIKEGRVVIASPSLSERPAKVVSDESQAHRRSPQQAMIFLRHVVPKTTSRPPPSPGVISMSCPPTPLQTSPQLQNRPSPLISSGNNANSLRLPSAHHISPPLAGARRRTSSLIVTSRPSDLTIGFATGRADWSGGGTPGSAPSRGAISWAVPRPAFPRRSPMLSASIGGPSPGVSPQRSPQICAVPEDTVLSDTEMSLVQHEQQGADDKDLTVSSRTSSPPLAQAQAASQTRLSPLSKPRIRWATAGSDVSDNEEEVEFVLSFDTPVPPNSQQPAVTQQQQQPEIPSPLAPPAPPANTPVTSNTEMSISTTSRSPMTTRETAASTRSPTRGDREPAAAESVTMADEGEGGKAAGGGDEADTAQQQQQQQQQEGGRGAGALILRRIRLEQKWAIWFDPGAKSKKVGHDASRYESNLCEMGSFETVEDYWRFWNNIDLKKLPKFSNISVFRDGVKPIWEDEHNEDGGRWVIRAFSAEDSQDFYTRLVLSMIGMQLTGHDEMNGAVLSIRPRGNTIALWNATVDSSLFEVVDLELRSIFGKDDGFNQDVDIEYRDHQGAMQHNEASVQSKRAAKNKDKDKAAKATRKRSPLIKSFIPLTTITTATDTDKPTDKDTDAAPATALRVPQFKDEGTTHQVEADVAMQDVDADKPQQREREGEQPAETDVSMTDDAPKTTTSLFSADAPEFVPGGGAGGGPYDEQQQQQQYHNPYVAAGGGVFTGQGYFPDELTMAQMAFNNQQAMSGAMQMPVIGYDTHTGMPIIMAPAAMEWAHAIAQQHQHQLQQQQEAASSPKAAEEEGGTSAKDEKMAAEGEEGGTEGEGEGEVAAKDETMAGDLQQQQQQDGSMDLSFTVPPGAIAIPVLYANYPHGPSPAFPFYGNPYVDHTHTHYWGTNGQEQQQEQQQEQPQQQQQQQ
ncbi:unnamed protein product [Vitrella brassicaformis CCMP3155]|uniref:Uncharacterized protein n=3 Tax=Vitrella brassicaformis TaxID=1169539 RepID=A0A0G4EP99_VITBC|nr:unnamed protein product [Vitrella brassicaformis CCMP3155]|eukprot:CEL99637.1 unnamed protein product [Vitrella brassicaformis CCMP3155]